MFSTTSGFLLDFFLVVKLRHIQLVKSLGKYENLMKIIPKI
jgi:hypothetical protein